jgi:ribonuclease Y
VLVPAIVTAVVASAVFAVWVANRKRIAAETVGRAEEQALRIVREAERDSEARKKETLLEAKEKAHETLVAAERQARQDRQQSAALEQTLAKRDADLAQRRGTIERTEKDLAARERAVADREKAAAASAAKYQQLVVTQQRELERLAGLTADEAKDLLV